MQKNRTISRLARTLRRGAALFAAMAALWLLWKTADFGADARNVPALGGSADAAGLLRWELGDTGQQGLTGLARLAAGQSSLLSAGLAAWPWPEDSEESQAPEQSSQPILTPPSAAPSAPIESQPLPTETTAPDSIIPRTMVPGSSSRYVSADGICIYNYTDYSLDIQALVAAAPKLGLKDSAGPQVLIYHSHTTESYTMDGADIYTESDAYRTTDPRFNMIRIGEEMREVFEAAELEVIHDETLYDYPVYSGAYGRSAQGIEAILEQYPSIQLVLDVHRDALAGTDGTVYKTAAGTVEDCAQVMMVVGTDAGGQKHKNWRQNLSMAVGLQRALTDRHGTLARPIVLRSSRFNQQMNTGAILVEVGSHGNTLQEAITAARLFAQTAADTLG